ncbi:MAG: hypothetical protein O7B81_12690, partial [Gammaproteobacteria bacterium]|nr:hypothetical protein [Gammaproteobacteria bacterium]
NGGFGSWAARIEIDRADAADRHAPDRMTLVLALSPGADAAAIGASNMRAASRISSITRISPSNSPAWRY